MIFVTMAAFFSVAFVVGITIWRLSDRNAHLVNQAAAYAMIAGKARQALADASLHPGIDNETSTYLNLVMTELDRDLSTRKEIR